MSNIKAFLSMISWCEGTKDKGDDGYNVLVGGELFEGYKDHPRKLIHIPRLNISSSAAGRYQILERYFDYYKRILKLHDFSPRSQDKIAIRMIREQKAYSNVQKGLIKLAIHKVNDIWASLPGSPYGQGEKPIEQCLAIYEYYGGKLL